MWSRKSAGRNVRMRARFLKLLRVPDGYKFGGCDAGADKNLNPQQVYCRNTAALEKLNAGQ